MLIKIYTIFLVIFLCEAATKIGLGNGRPSEEPSSLKTEVMKFKTSECGGSSSEEDSHGSKNRKNKHRNKKDSDEEDDDDDDSEEDNKKKNKNQRGKNNRGRQKNKGHHEDYSSGYGSSSSFEHNRNFGMNREPQEDYLNRRPGGDPYQTRWDTPNRNPYPNPQFNNRNNQFNPFGQTPENGDIYPQNSNRRGPNHPQGPYGAPREPNNRGGYPFQDRNEDDRYFNRDDRNGNRRKQQNKNKWDDSSDEEDERNSGRRNGQRRQHNRNGSKGGRHRNNKNENRDGECTSQCVFNNMEIMEDDGIPSEAGMIKWAQDNIKNEKLKQSAVKEIRKCFGTLASSDGDNSCNFSKSLAKCLKLGLDEEKD